MNEIRRDFAFQILSVSWLELKKIIIITFLYNVLGPILEKEIATHSSILPWRILMNRGVWQATVHGVAKSQTQLKRLSTHR